MKDIKIGVVGLGYVGLPLAIELSKDFNLIGYDISREKIEEYSKGVESTEEIEDFEIKSKKIHFTNKEEELKTCNFIIVTVPTPINKDETPDLRPLEAASKTIGKYLNEGDIVVYESTVYPGTTEEVCIPLLEIFSGLKINLGFSVGYSPERINPGDKNNTIRSIKKVIAASNNQALEVLEQVYSKVVDAGLHKASSIKVAEASKVIENAQRDINIAFFNELAIVFKLMNINTNEVIKAASTKWNFLPFSPGLVGGHCIGVDPYYFIYKADDLGYKSELLKTGRVINNEIPNFIVNSLFKEVVINKISTKDLKIGIMGLTFKEDCKDTRNSKVLDIITKLNDYEIKPIVFEPNLNLKNTENYSPDFELVSEKKFTNLDVLIIAVKHKYFLKNYDSVKIKQLFKENEKKILMDLKETYNKEDFEESFLYWSL